MKVKMILSVIISIAILACGDNERPVIDRVVAPEPKPIKPNLAAPVIKKIVVPDQIRAGARITLEAVAEDEDGNTLTYNWQAPGKLKYTKTLSSIVFWTAPIDLGVATITLTVDDGINKTTKSAEVKVTNSLIVPGEEIAGIKLSDRLWRIIDLYGEPTHREESTITDRWDTRVNWKNAGLTVYLRSNRIREIMISAPHTAKTEGGNGIGSNCDDVRDELTSKFGQNQGGGSSSEKYQHYDWDYAGIEVRCRLATVVQFVIREKEPKFANLK
jgi:hypothetical protein